MKKINICYFSIIFIMILTNYTNKIFGKILNENIFKDIRILMIFLLLIFTIFIFILEKNILKIDVRKIIELLFFTTFLRKFYLSFFIIIISKFINKETRLKILLFVLCFFYSIILILNFEGYLNFNNLEDGIRNFENFKICRYSLGFGNPNIASYLLLPIFFTFYYLYFPKYKKSVIGIILLIEIIFFKLTFSRTSFFLIILFLMLILIKDKYLEKFKPLFFTEIFLLLFFTFYLPFYLKNTILNKIFSGRLKLFHYYLINYKITLFGGNETKKFYEMYPLDNAYLRTLFENGIIGFIFLSLLLFLLMYLLFQNKDYKSVRIFSVVLIFGFMESLAFLYYFNVIYYIISDYIFTETNSKYSIYNIWNKKLIYRCRKN